MSKMKRTAHFGQSRGFSLLETLVALGALLLVAGAIFELINAAQFRAALAQPFIWEAYEKACALVREGGELIAVGYSFNAHDRASYDPVLQALLESRERRLIIVSPNAGESRGRIKAEYFHLEVEAIGKTLKSSPQGPQPPCPHASTAVRPSESISG